MAIQVFYYCGANAQPTGGNKIVYRHVDLLARAGLDAWVYHPIDGFAYTGLVQDLRVVSPSTIVARRADLFVLPEDAGPGLAAFAPGMRKLIFNQNTYYSFRHFGLDPLALPPYERADVIGAMVVSEDNQRYLRFAFPGLACERLVLSLNFELFAYVPWHRKRRQIAYMTRKNQDDVAQVLKILASRGRLADWRLVPIEGCPEYEVARILRESRLFLAFGHPEGLSLSNLEALACGCRLIGYSGRAGRDYFGATGSIEIEVGDILGFCKAVEEFVGRADVDAGHHERIAEKASAFVQDAYSNERERQTLLRVVGGFLATLDQASP